jgi:hypothetical protein
VDIYNVDFKGGRFSLLCARPEDFWILVDVVELWFRNSVMELQPMVDKQLEKPEYEECEKISERLNAMRDFCILFRQALAAAKDEAVYYSHSDHGTLYYKHLEERITDFEKLNADFGRAMSKAPWIPKF